MGWWGDEGCRPGRHVGPALPTPAQSCPLACHRCPRPVLPLPPRPPAPAVNCPSSCASHDYAGQPATVNGAAVVLPAGLGCIPPAAGGAACPAGMISATALDPLTFFSQATNSTQNGTQIYSAWVQWARGCALFHFSACVALTARGTWA